MKKFILVSIFIFLFTGVYSADKISESSIDKEIKTDSVLNDYTDDEFKQAVIQVLQKGNVTNKELFVKELELVRKGDVAQEKKLYGLENIDLENAKGMTGWDVAISGIIVVFTGLMLIMLVLYLFNYLLQPKTAKLAKPSANKIIVEEIPEDILIAIATTVELYTRLYSSDKLMDLSFTTTESDSWKIKNKFVQGS